MIFSLLLSGIAFYDAQPDGLTTESREEILNNLDVYEGMTWKICTEIPLGDKMICSIYSEQKNGIYTLWGYGYDIYGENKVICAKVNARGNVEVWKECPADYATCVRYLDDEVYVLEYTNGMESLELTPYDEFVNP